VRRGSRQLERVSPFAVIERRHWEMNVQVVDDGIGKTSEAELLALTVHEFRTPVTVVCGYLRMLAREQLGPLNDRQRKLIEESERSCARLSALVGELSDLANLDAGAVKLASQDVPLRGLLDEAVACIEDGRDREVRVEVQGAADGESVNGDRTRLTAALTALVRGVVREQTEPGRVLVDVAVTELDGRRTAAIGIARDRDLPQLAQNAPLAELNEFRGGMGLSVPIARRVIARHGGRVWSSAGGRHMGAVAVRLPLKETRS
jgi:signal transduction histidine kinase